MDAELKKKYEMFLAGYTLIELDGQLSVYRPGSGRVNIMLPSQQNFQYTLWSDFAFFKLYGLFKKVEIR